MNMIDMSRYDKLDLTPEERLELALYDAKVDNEDYYKYRDGILKRKRDQRAYNKAYYERRKAQDASG